MDWDDIRLFPASLMLGLSAAAAVMMTLILAAFSMPLWPASAALAALLCMSASTLDPDRAWSIRLARWMAAPSATVWLAATLLVEGGADLTIAVFCVSMAALSASVGRWLSDGEQAEPVGPPVIDRGATVAVTAEGWIEELDESVAGAVIRTV